MAEIPNPNPQTHLQIKKPSMDPTILQAQTPMEETPNPNLQTHVETKKPSLNPPPLQAQTPMAPNPQTHAETKKLSLKTFLQTQTPMAETPNPNPQTHVEINKPSLNPPLLQAQTPMAETPNPNHQTHAETKKPSLRTFLQTQTQMAETPNPNPQTHVETKKPSLNPTFLQTQTPMAETPNPNPRTHTKRPSLNPSFSQNLTPIAESPNHNPQTRVDIKAIQQRMSTELTAEELLKEQKLPFPFFRPLSQRKESTWVISVFVILHLIAFTATMVINDCWGNSHAQCVFKQLGRFSFQPLQENPLLGPSASALDAAGALRLRYLTNNHQMWRLFTSPCLHAGLFHLIISLSSVIFVGIHLEQEFGSLRIGVIYILSAVTGALLAALFLQDRPSVASSAALFGLLGTTLSGLIQYWKVYTKKFKTLIALFVILMLNVILGLMPFVNNFSNIGGFISGFFSGFILLFKPQVMKVHQNKGGIFKYKHSVKPIRKLDRPISRIISLIVLSLLVAGVVVAVLRGINLNKYCGWCKYIDCVPLRWWSCSDESVRCLTMVSSEQLTITCSDNGKFRVLPYANVSKARVEDICNLVCS